MFFPFQIRSGKRDSDSRPQPWQGCALPTELLPHAIRCEEKETRTPTTQLSLPPQSSASTNSAISPNIKELPGAQNRTRTCTLGNTRTWNVRVYQFRHLGSKNWNQFLFWLYSKCLSGKRDSDPRPQPWQGCALPTELFPQLIPNC